MGCRIEDAIRFVGGQLVTSLTGIDTLPCVVIMETSIDQTKEIHKLDGLMF